MSSTDKTLQDTIGEALKETTKTSKASEIETEEGISKEAATGETKTGETPEYVAGIDISDIPEQDRPKFREKLSLKAKLLEDGYQVKFKEVAQFKKAQDELIRMGLTTDEAYDVLVKHIEQKRNPQTSTTQKKEAVKVLDRLIEQADYQQKPTLEQMRQIILEETEADKLRKEIKDLTILVNELRGESVISKKTKVEQYLDSVSDKFGKELIDKYKDNFIDAHLNYKIPLEKLITAVIPFEELEQAILSKGKKQLTQEKKEAISSKPSGITSSEKIDTKNESLSSLIGKVIKMK